MIDPRSVSAVLISKDPVYPAEVLAHTCSFPFAEVLIFTGCDSPHRKQELFEKAKYPYIYYSDDDCIAPIAEVLDQAVPGIITCAMKPAHINSYSRSRIALLGWGSVFPQKAIVELSHYRDEYGEDDVYKRETERIMTWFNYPQLRLALPIEDLPSAFAADRLSNQPNHYNYIPLVEERCRSIAAKIGIPH